MNWDKFRTNIGWKFRLLPPANHFDAEGELLHLQPDDDWELTAVSGDVAELRNAAGLVYLLGKDHLRDFSTDPARNGRGPEHYGFIRHNDSIRIQGGKLDARPQLASGLPPSPTPSRAQNARMVLVPEFVRIARRQVFILDRAMANFGRTSFGHTQPTGDTWPALRPFRPDVFLTSPMSQDLGVGDAEVLGEFYGSVREVEDTLASWIETSQSLDDVNAWVVLQHKAADSLRKAIVAVQRLCREREFDPTMPASGTLLERIGVSLGHLKIALDAHLERHSRPAAPRVAPKR
jgi:hypothetical protein